MTEPLIIYFNDEKLVKSSSERSKFLTNFKPLTKNNSIPVNGIEDFETLINYLPDKLLVFVLIHIMADALGENISEDNIEFQGKIWAISLRKQFINCKFLFVTSNLSKLNLKIYDDVPAYNITDLMNEIYVKKTSKFLPQKICDIKRNDKMNSIESLENEFSISDINENKQVDFAVLTALAKNEYEMFANKFNTIDELDANNKKVVFKEIKTNAYPDYLEPFLIMKQERMGTADAIAFATKTIVKENPHFLIMAGVCGGRKGKVNLYDIIIPSQSIDLVTGKIEDVEGKKKHVLYDYSAPTNNKLIEYLKDPEMITNIKNSMFSLIDNSDKKYNEIVGKLDIRFDDMACVPYVVNIDGYLEHNAKNYNNKIIGLEMESYGVLRANTLFQNSGHFSLVVKSVMDYTDGHKSDNVDGIEVQETAAYISYLCTRAMMPYLIKFHKNKLWIQ